MPFPDLKYGDWKIAREIGKGSFGTVYEIERRDFQVVTRAALKIISIPPDQSEVRIIRSQGMDEDSVTDYYQSVAEDVVQEFELMSRLKGYTNIVSYEDHSIRKKSEGIGWDVLIRMELLTSLDDYLARGLICRRDVVRMGIDLCNALERCHKLDIIHRDIKPDNIFVSSQGDFKLGDFGVARKVERTIAGLSRKGTFTYMAPEAYHGEPYGFSADIYSLGLVMYRLLNAGRAPFMPPYPEKIRFQDQEEALARRMQGEQLPAPAESGDALAAVVLKACSYVPGDRYASAAEFAAALRPLLDAPSSEVLVCNPLAELDGGTKECSQPKPAVDKTVNVWSAQSSGVAVQAEQIERVVQATKSEPTIAVRVEPEPGQSAPKPEPAPKSEAAPKPVQQKPVPEPVQSSKRKATTTSAARKPRPKGAGKDKTAQRKGRRGIYVGAVAVILVVVAVLAMQTLPSGETQSEQVSEELVAVALETADVVGKSDAKAEETLTEKGWTVQKEAEASSDVDEGEVITQSYDEATGVATIVVSSGPKQVSVPNLVGSTQKKASDKLKGCGLKLGKTTKKYSSKKKGTVISQSPKKGKKVDEGTKVAVTISKGKKPKKTTTTTSSYNDYSSYEDYSDYSGSSSSSGSSSDSWGDISLHDMDYS